jgi:predicted dienelactone hydrolase
MRRISASVFGFLSLLGGAELRAQPPTEGRVAELPSATSTVPVGYRKLQFTYSVKDRPTRTRDYFLWYPTSDREERYDYKGQIGVAAADGAIASGRHPLIVFSHGFLGAGDQIIFLTESLARSGYIVAAPNHADSGSGSEPIEIPNFIDARSWDDKKFVDRKEDLSALIDHLLGGKDSAAFLRDHVDERAIGVAGHSLGGYVALGMAGARPAWRDERIRAALILSPYALPYVDGSVLSEVRVPVMLQGGTRDWALTPFLPAVYEKLRVPKYFLILNDASHLEWTNLISLGRSTTDAVLSGSARWITAYSVAFFDSYLRGQERSALLAKPNPQLYSYEYSLTPPSPEAAGQE